MIGLIVAVALGLALLAFGMVVAGVSWDSAIDARWAWGLVCSLGMLIGFLIFLFGLVLALAALAALALEVTS